MYVGVILILDVTSPNLVNTQLSYIEKVKAQLYFFQDKDGIIKYTDPQLWTSSWFTQEWQEGDFTQVYIDSQPTNPDRIAEQGMTTVTNSFTPSRDSH